MDHAGHKFVNELRRLLCHPILFTPKERPLRSSQEQTGAARMGQEEPRAARRIHKGSSTCSGLRRSFANL